MQESFYRWGAPSGPFSDANSANLTAALFRDFASSVAQELVLLTKEIATLRADLEELKQTPQQPLWPPPPQPTSTAEQLVYEPSASPASYRPISEEEESSEDEPEGAVTDLDPEDPASGEFLGSKSDLDEYPYHSEEPWAPGLFIRLGNGRKYHWTGEDWASGTNE